MHRTEVRSIVNDMGCTDRRGLKTILVPTDFLEPSDVALQLAIDLAKQQNARIHLLHVLRFRHGADEMERIKKQVAKFPEAKSVEIVPEIRTGKIDKEILKAETEKNIDLIVIARHEKKGLARGPFNLFRSVTQRVKRNARRSVLVVGA